MTDKRKGLFVFILLFSLVFSGKWKVLAEEAKPLAVEDTAYGDHAYSYLSTIVNSFPKRETAKGNSWACGDWIIDKLNTMGYSVSIHEFLTKAGDQKGRNIIVERRGASDKTIVLCAHYDSADTQGCDDNASGTAVLLELAERIAKASEVPQCSLRIIFFDDEEEGPWGSQMYCNDQSEEYFANLIAVINIDSVAAGDKMYIHGGDFEGNKTWLRDIALDLANKMSLNMTTHPEVNYIPAGTRVNGSDQRYFAERGVSYIYLEANLYSNDAADGLPMHYQTANPEVENGQIMHTSYDDLATIEKLFPGRVASYLKNYTELTLCLAYNITEGSQYEERIYLAKDMSELVQETETETEAETEKEAETEPVSETQIPSLTDAEMTSEEAINTVEDTEAYTETLAETETATIEAATIHNSQEPLTTESLEIILKPAESASAIVMPTAIDDDAIDVGWIWIAVAGVLVFLLASAICIMFRVYSKLKKKKRRKNKKK